MKRIVFSQLFLRFFIIVLLIPGIAAAEIYSWTDAHGKLHYSDKKPPNNDASTVSLPRFSPQWQQFEIEINQIKIQLTEQELKRINDDINAVYYFFKKKLYIDVYKTIPVKVRLFGSKADYKAYIKQFSELYTNTRGAYFSSRNEIVVYMRKDRDGTFRTIKHEASHAIIHTILPYIPEWLNEGIAENMEVVATDGNSIYLEPHPENYKNLSRHSKRHSLPNIEDMLSYKSVDWKKKNRDSNYALQTQAGELVRMLLSDAKGKSFIIKIIHEFKFGDRTLVSHLAEKHYFGGSFGLQSKWEDWVSRSNSRRVNL